MTAFDAVAAKHGLAPLVGADPRILILGSLPGDESIARQEYYGHPRNRFWKVLAAVFGESVPETYGQKKEFLFRHRVALWDVYASAERDGSTDARIKNPVTNDIPGFLAAHPGIRIIALNGGKAAGAYKAICRAAGGGDFAAAAGGMVGGAVDGRVGGDVGVAAGRGYSPSRPAVKVFEFASTSPMSVSSGWTLEKLIAQWKEMLNG